MSEMDEVKEFMNRFSRDFETKFGMAIDDKLEQKVKITLLASGFGIQDIHMKEMDDRITQRTAEEQQRLAELEEEEEQRSNRREVYYGKDANARSQRSRRRHIYLFKASASLRVSLAPGAVLASRNTFFTFQPRLRNQIRYGH